MCIGTDIETEISFYAEINSEHKLVARNSQRTFAA